MEILIYGFGRMGITHYSILNSIVDDAKFTFVEPNKLLNFISKKNIKGKFVSSDKNLKNSYDLTLITTPPFVHKDIIERSLKRGDKKIFVEKPFGGYNNTKFEVQSENIFIGYVLRFNPIVNWVKENIDPKGIEECSAKYLSNTIENKPNGWRNGHFSGVLNEMGSHVIDMINYLFDISDFKLLNVDIKSIISDVDDIAEFSLQSKQRKFNFYFNWVEKSIRKPVFGISLKLKNGDSILIDQQKIVINKGDQEKVISVVDIREEIPFYLRGIDFTKQMQDLVNNQERMCSFDEGLLVNKLMKEVIQA